MTVLEWVLIGLGVLGGIINVMFMLLVSLVGYIWVSRMKAIDDVLKTLEMKFEAIVLRLNNHDTEFGDRPTFSQQREKFNEDFAVKGESLINAHTSKYDHTEKGAA